MIRYMELRKRIEKDKARKAARRAARIEKYDNMDRVATARHYVKATRKCRNGVRFKLSVQAYCAKPFQMMTGDKAAMLEGITPPVTASRKITIRERGKERTITPIQMRDRVNQRVLCDYALTPMIAPRLIYDNGASMKGKGVGFARKRFNAMLEKAKRQWGSEFYALTFDFRRFFDSIPHRLCREELGKVFRDQRIIDVTMGYVEGYQLNEARKAGDWERVASLGRHEGIGVCLGSHVSQVMALCVPNFLDHWLKDVKREKLYIRYMDDGVILHRDPEHLRQLLHEMARLCEKNEMRLNIAKTHITPMKRGICFLKTRYRLDGMKTVKRLCPQSVTRMRRRLQRFARLVDSGKMTMEMVDASLQSWMGHTLRVMAFRQRKRIRQVYRECFKAKGACA